MKKVLSVLLAVLCVFSCFAVAASAEEGLEPEKTPSGYYEGQLLTPGDEITTSFAACDSLIFTYTVGADDAENVSSAMQKKYAEEGMVGLTTFRDNIASFTTGEAYAGVYHVKAIGDAMDEMETMNGAFKSGNEIAMGLSDSDEDVVVKMDYAYAKTTFFQYTEVVAWEVVSVRDTENGLNIRVKAVFETREPNGFESVVEKIYVQWKAFLDVLGNYLLVAVPAFFAKIAAALGKN